MNDRRRKKNNITSLLPFWTFLGDKHGTPEGIKGMFLPIIHGTHGFYARVTTATRTTRAPMASSKINTEGSEVSCAAEPFITLCALITLIYGLVLVPGLINGRQTRK